VADLSLVLVRLGERGMENPKNWNDIARLIRYFTSDSDIILDFFAGSGTTGHSTILQNAIDLSTRRYILVQLPEPLTQDNKEQVIPFNFLRRLGRPTNIAEITKERLRKSANKVRAEHPDSGRDLGFRVFKLASSNIRTWEPNRDNLGTSLEHAVEHLKSDRTEQDVLYELLLKLGLVTCSPTYPRS
jgi:adenine-specific DNA-methyltransferase